MSEPATDAEIETFRTHAQSHDRAKFHGHEMLRVLARLDAERARAESAEALAGFASHYAERCDAERARAEAAEAKVAKAQAALCDAVACLGGFHSDRVPQSVRDAILANIDKGGSET